MSKSNHFLLQAFVILWAMISSDVMAFSWGDGVSAWGKVGRPNSVTFSRGFSGSCINCDLAGRNLGGARLNNGNFVGAQFAGAQMRRAELDGGNFSNSDFSRADLGFASLEAAHIFNGNFVGATLNLSLIHI